jgi:hypothetical protein
MEHRAHPTLETTALDGIEDDFLWQDVDKNDETDYVEDNGRKVRMRTLE